MEELEPIKFTIGEEYINEKGAFEVKSIKGNEMVIRWKTGEEMACDVGLQLRIQERRRWEELREEQLAAAAAAKLRKASSATAGKAFVGLQPNDFQNKISRTTWRSRKQLGGAVVRRLSSNRLNLNSWAAKRRNEVIYADVAQWKVKQNSCPAKFFAHADENSLIWGFSVERSYPEGPTPSDWEAFVEWAADGENEGWLREVALKAELEIYDALGTSFKGVLKPQDSGWAVEVDGAVKSADSLKAAVDSWPKDKRLDLVIAKRIPKADAIEQEKKIAVEIADTIGLLLPVYGGVVVPGK